MISACRSDEQRLESEVRAAIAAGDIPALTARAYQPVAVRILSPYSRAFADLLAGGYALPLRVMRGLQISGETHKTFTKAATIRKLREATGRNAEIIRGLLTGEGDPAAVMLRRVAEAVRAVPLDVYDLSEAATRETVSFEVRSEATKRAAVTRAERDKGSGKSAGTSVTPERHGVSVVPKPKPRRAPVTRAERMEKLAADMAVRAEREAAKEVKRAEVRARRQREAAERKRRKRECSEADVLEPRLSYRERQALEGPQ